MGKVPAGMNGIWNNRIDIYCNLAGLIRTDCVIIHGIAAFFRSVNSNRIETGGDVYGGFTL